MSFEIFATVERSDAISDIAARLDHSESYVSRAVADLSEKGVVCTERDGRRKRIIPSDARAVEIYHDPELLTGKTLEDLYHFDQSRTVTELAEASDSYRNTVNRILRRLQHRGLVGADDGYRFNDEFNRLHAFARELAHHLYRQRLESVAPSETILWQNYDEFLVQTETEINAEETGLARFAECDLQFLLTSRRCYVYPEQLEPISPAISAITPS